jgi:hypothetical protein
MLGYLASIVPIPGGIGVLEAGLSGALILYGVSPAHAVAAVLIYHTIALWVPGLGGLCAYLGLRPRPVGAGKPAPVAEHRQCVPAGRMSSKLLHPRLRQGGQRAGLRKYDHGGCGAVRKGGWGGVGWAACGVDVPCRGAPGCPGFTGWET